jgi:hypothetical protein
MKEIPKPQKEIKNLVFFNRDCCVIYFPIFIFCFGVSNKKLTKKKKNHSVNPRNSFVFYCYHYLRSLVSPPFFWQTGQSVVSHVMNLLFLEQIVFAFQYWKERERETQIAREIE